MSHVATDAEEIDEKLAGDIVTKLKDRKWRLENLYYVMDERGKKVRFKPNVAQSQLLDNLWWKNIVLKARQLGFTTFIQIFILDSILFTKNLRAGVSAHNRTDAKSFFSDKIKFAYDNLDDWVRPFVPKAIKNEAGELKLDNNSSVRVGVSLRSGTFQILHVSEYGKLCRHFPNKAQEVKTGTMNTLHGDSIAFIESTAEGRAGDFYRMSTEAQKNSVNPNFHLTNMDYRFHFFPWWQDPRYTIDPTGVVLLERHLAYFGELRAKHGIKLTAGQMSWYVKKESEQGAESMKQEFPSTWEEAFEASVEGTYYSTQMNFLRENGRLTEVPWEPSIGVSTFWDLGMNDETAIWFHQRVGTTNRLIDFYQNSGEGFEHYAQILRDKGYHYLNHYLPHDVAVRELGANGRSREQSLVQLGIKPIVKVPRARNLDEVLQGIQAVRAFLPSCWIDETTCADGIIALDNYRKKRDETNGGWMKGPAHTPDSNPADAIRTGAVGFKVENYITDSDVMPDQTEDY